MSGDITDVALKQVIGECVQEESGLYMISIRQKEELEESVFNAIRRLDVLQELLEDDTITEIMINGKDDIFLERNGHITKWDKSFENEERLEDIAQKIASLSNKIVNISSPIADTRLEDGSRVSIVPVSYTHLRAHETPEHLVCRLLLEKIFLMIRRPPRSTRVRSSAASDVYKRQCPFIRAQPRISSIFCLSSPSIWRSSRSVRATYCLLYTSPSPRYS